MKVSAILVFVGVIFVLIGLVAPTLPAQMITTQGSGLLAFDSVNPNSQTASEPTVFNNPNINIYGIFYDANIYIGKPTIDQVSGIFEINNVQLTPQITTFDMVQNARLGIYYAAIKVTYNYTTTSTSEISVYFHYEMYVTGQAGYGNSNTTYSYFGTYTFYGIYKPPILKNIGNFYISTPSTSSYTTPTEITESSIINFSATSSSIPVTFYYVENNGTTTNMSSVYIELNNVNYYLFKNDVFNKTSVNGYNASYITLNLAPGMYSLSAYVQSTAYKSNATEITSATINMPQEKNTVTTTITPPHPTNNILGITIYQLADFIIGGLLIAFGMFRFIRGH